MTRPRLEACYFGDGIYERMARVLEHTARQQCAGWTINVQRIDPQPMHTVLLKDSYLHNTQKMAHWDSVIQGSDDGDEVLIIDSDTMLLSPLGSIWAEPFDIAITSKRHTRFPFNSGVVFVRVSDRTRVFTREWLEANVAMLGDKALHLTWQQKYGGINQASLGKMLEQHVLARLGVNVLEIPCAEWNCEDSHWATFDPARTRVVHIKSALRRRVFESESSPDVARARRMMAMLKPGSAQERAIERLAAIWRCIEAEIATPAEVRTA